MHKSVLVLAAAAQVLGASTLAGQERSSVRTPAYVWATGGIGPSTEGFAAVVGLDLQIRTHLLSVRTAGAAGLFENSLQDYGVLLGEAYRGKQGMIALSAGVGMMNGTLCTGLFG